MKTFLFSGLLILALCTGIYAQTPIFQFTHKGSVIHIKFSPSGSKLLSYSSGNQDMCMWDVKTGRVLWKRPISFIKKADEYYTINVLAWSPEEQYVATGSANGTVQLWSALTGEFLWIADVAKRDVSAIAFSPDGNVLAAVPYSDQMIAAKLIETATGTVVKTLSGDNCEHIAVTFDPTGTELRVGDRDTGIVTWSLDSGRLVSGVDATCRSKYSYGGDRTYSPDLTLSARRTTADKLVIENREGKPIKETKFNDSRLSATFDSHSKLSVIGEYSGFRLFDLENGVETKLEDCISGNAIDLSPDGAMFAQSCDGFKTAIKVTDLKSRKVTLLDGHPGYVHSIAFSPDYSLLAVAGNDGNAYLFEPNNKSLIRTLVGDGHRLTALTFRPDGKTLLTGDENGSLHEWEVASGEHLKDVKLDDRSDDVEIIDASNDGKGVFVVMNHKLLLLNADLSLKRAITTPDGYSETSGNMTITFSSVPVSGASFLSDGSTVTGHSDGSIRIWDSASGRQLRKIVAADDIRLLAAIPTRTAIAALVKDRDKTTLLVVSAEEGKVIGRSNAFEGSFAEKMMVSPDGHYAVITDISGDAFIVDLNSMTVRELNRLSGSDSVAFDSGSKSFFIGGENQNLELYDTVSLKKLWQLLPEFQPSAAERRLDEGARLRNKVLEDIKSKRDKQAASDVEKYSKMIAVSFLHFGDMSDPGEKRMIESDKVKESKQVKPDSSADAAWFRLTNNSPLPIDIPTESMYLPDKKCFHQFPGGEKMYGSCGEREAGIWFGVKDRHGQWVPYGFDFGSSINLLPGSSVVFPIPLSLLNKDYRIVFSYTFQNTRASENDREWDYGDKVEISIDKSLIPK